ncbi:MATE family efflux transporter [Taklimakanibacter albus]|uniref:MATE family efflux transporter n=1 Tax=Taklimakanibacter albus TaxID=2800327 RepID=A0ACC5RE48_9HYPH|nr:MATE family efflux transporter [Aestuariivirga sp. YIM B02566]MBK1870888.1 MATE family efflux transporter [Aestuariivirga sp. YIM B02566]
MHSPQSTPVTHRGVLAIAVPIMLSNVTQPIIGIVNAAVIGQLPGAYYIGAITVGALIFNFIYWGFGFLRLGTGGLSAQATGRGDAAELVAVLIRALIIAVIAGVAIILLSPLIGKLTFSLINGSEEVERHAAQYFYIRVFSAPFALMDFCLIGWFVGQGRARVAFLLQIYLNLTNGALSLFFVLGLGMTSDGVALAVLIAEVTAALLGLIIAFGRLKEMGARFERARVFDRAQLIRTFVINRDIMIRTVCLVLVFSWFTARGAQAGDVIVSANAVLMHFFDFAAFLIDGFALATEALVGQAVGARDRQRFNTAIQLTWVWLTLTGVAAAALIWFGGPFFIDLMAANEDVRATARIYLFWVALTPLAGIACFQYDGIFTGATQTADMRNMMLLSMIITLIAWWPLELYYANHGLWATMIVFFVSRGILFALRMPALRRTAFG